MNFFSITLVVIFTLGSSQALGSMLDEFEEDATGNSRVTTDDDTYEYNQGEGCNTFSDCVFEAVLEVAFEVVLFGGDASQQRSTGNLSDEWLDARVVGSPMLPLFRIDLHQQWAGSSVTANDLRIESGYGMWAAQARVTKYREQKPSDSLDLSQLSVLYRMSFGNKVGINIGLGKAYLSGNSEHSGFVWSFPFYWHPSKHYGIEWKQSYINFNGNMLSDMDWSLLYNFQHASIALGYRSLESESADLSGPYLGFSLRY